jgi:hypothetical protein
MAPGKAIEGSSRNPYPKKEVGWGDQSWDEMMVGFLNLVFPAGKAINPPVNRR